MVGLLFARDSGQNFKPKDGFVPNEKTAIAIAVAILTPIFGEKTIQEESPFKAILKDGVWRVQGTLPTGHIGGSVVAEILKEDARILRVSHGQ